MLLSVDLSLLNYPTSKLHALNTFNLAGYSSPAGLSPNAIRGAYGLGTYDTSGVLSNAITFHGIQGDGSGQTIAIVDAYDNPNALSDLNAFSSYYHLPTFNGAGGPTFQKLNQTGGTSLPGTDPNGPYSTTGQGTWEQEESLDVQWAHAMAPMANIILYEATSNSNAALYAAVATAAKAPGVVAVSMSWSSNEFSTETTYDSYFLTPSGHAGVTFLASAGDNGAYAPGTTTITAQYPACSPNVIAVGGTSLSVSGNNYSSETTWGNGTSSGTSGGGGGGISVYESQPSYQNGVVNAYSTTKRTYPDVSLDANPNTGVPIYDSWDFGVSTPWVPGYMGGTSLSAPLLAAMVTIADQGRSAAGLASLDGRTQTLPQLYKLASGDFHDITSGSSIATSPTYSPATGYDLATGLGSTVGNLLIPQLAGPSLLAFGQGPTNAAAGAPITPAVTVRVEDSLGNLVTSDTSNVTIAIGANPAGGALSGTLTVAAVNGIATFSGLSVDRAGSGYTLIVTDGGLTSATSAAFNIATNTAQPTVASPATASPNPVVSGTTTGLSVLGADDGGEANLTYAWTATTLPAGAAQPTYSANGTNAAKNTTATFNRSGTYGLQVTITDAGGLSTTSIVSVTVDQTYASINVSPGPVTLSVRSQQQFTATALDQFGVAMGAQPAFTWTADSGAVTSAGLYTPPSTAGSATVRAQSGSFSGTAAIQIIAPVGWWNFNEGSGAIAGDSATNPDNGAISSATWGQPPNGTNGTPSLQFNGTNSLVNLGNPSKLDFNGQITISAWVKPGNITADQYLVDHRTGTSNDLFLMITAAGNYQVGVNNGSLHVASAAVPSQDLNTWVHLAGVYDGTTWRLYRNGQMLASATDATGAILIPSGNWGIGGAASGSSRKRFFTGSIDDVRIYSSTVSDGAIAGLAATPPTVATAAAASPSTVAATTTALSVLGADDAGESTLIYTWATTGPPSATVSFSANGSNAAKNTTATFTQTGVYSFIVTMTNVSGLSTTAGVNVTVDPALVSIVVTPATATVASDGQQQFTAALSDQFGAAMDLPGTAWSATAGSINSSGLFTAPYASASVTITATSGTVSGTASVTVTNATPTVAAAAAATPGTVTGTTTVLSVLGADDAGESNLIYTWAAAGTPPAPVGFSLNGSNAAKDTTATFAAAGAYDFTLTITDMGGLSTTSNVQVRVNQTLTSITVVPGTVTVASHATQQFTATDVDQFGAAMSPAETTWSATAGSIDGSGLFTAPYGTASVTVTAASGPVSGVATVNVTNAAPTVATPAAALPDTVTGTTTALSVLGEDDGGESNLTYSWAATGTPPAPVSFSANGSNAAKSTTAALSKAGTYGFTVTITDAVGATVTSSIGVTVDQTSTSIGVTPESVSIDVGGSQQFTATALDQFGSAMVSQPAFTWTTTVGTTTADGLVAAPDVSVSGTVTAVSGALSGTAAVSVTNQPPGITAAAAASPGTVTGKATALSVLGEDDGGESHLTYTWATEETPPAPVSFSANGSNAAKNTTAALSKAGTYGFTVTITDAGRLSATSSITVIVNQTLTNMTVTPAGGLSVDGTQPFSATGLDQFGNALVSQPSLTWSILGSGDISSSGVFTPPYTAGSATVLATSGAVTGSDTVSLPGEARWNSSGDASWSTADSWTSTALGSVVAAPGLRGIAGDTALFDSAAGSTITLNDVNPSVAGITFDSSNSSYTVSQGTGGAMHVGNGPDSASITVSSGSHTISAPVVLDSNVLVAPASGSTLAISGAISGPGASLALSGQGTVILGGTNSYTGGTTVTSGTLVVNHAGAIPSGTNLAISGSGAVVLGSDLPQAIELSGLTFEGFGGTSANSNKTAGSPTAQSPALAAFQQATIDPAIETPADVPNSAAANSPSESLVSAASVPIDPPSVAAVPAVPMLVTPALAVAPRTLLVQPVLPTIVSAATALPAKPLPQPTTTSIATATGPASPTSSTPVMHQIPMSQAPHAGNFATPRAPMTKAGPAVSSAKSLPPRNTKPKATIVATIPSQNSQTKARDTALRTSSVTRSVDLAWVALAEELDAQKRSHRKAAPTGLAVDEVLARFWK